MLVLRKIYKIYNIWFHEDIGVDDLFTKVIGV